MIVFFIFILTLLLITLLVFYQQKPKELLDFIIKTYRRWNHLKRAQVEIDDHSWVYLHNLDQGKGQVPIVFLHGFGADKDRWGKVLPALAKHYPIIVPDLPGFGESSAKKDQSYDIPSQCERLLHFLKNLNINQCHLLGLSMGGYMAAYFAAEHAKMVSSLILFDPAGATMPKKSSALKHFESNGEFKVIYKDDTGFEDMLNTVFYKKPYIPKAFRDIAVLEGARKYSFYTKIIQDILSSDGLYLLDQRLEKITAPTLLIWGEEDQVIDPSSSKAFIKKVPYIESHLFPKVGHVPNWEKPITVAYLCQNFLQRHAFAQKRKA